MFTGPEHKHLFLTRTDPDLPLVRQMGDSYFDMTDGGGVEGESAFRAHLSIGPARYQVPILSRQGTWVTGAIAIVPSPDGRPPTKQIWMEQQFFKIWLQNLNQIALPHQSLLYYLRRVAPDLAVGINDSDYRDPRSDLTFTLSQLSSAIVDWTDPFSIFCTARR